MKTEQNKKKKKQPIHLLNYTLGGREQSFEGINMKSNVRIWTQVANSTSYYDIYN